MAIERNQYQFYQLLSDVFPLHTVLECIDTPYQQEAASTTDSIIDIRILHGSVSVLGYSVQIDYVTWFSVLYVIGSYLRLYPLKQDGNTRFWAMLTLISVVVGVMSVIYLLYRGLYSPYYYISDSNQILSLIIGISSFMLFKNLHIPQSKWINTIASTTFGVLLIHANSDIMRQWLWKDTVDCVGHYADAHYIIYSVMVVLCIFFFCSVIDYIRIKLVEERMIGVVERIINQCLK